VVRIFESVREGEVSGRDELGFSDESTSFILASIGRTYMKCAYTSLLD
jgi:hypothetical protein